MLDPEFRADLHTHTNCSDGTATPTELVREAKQVGLQGLSITDHDTVEAYQEAIPIAREEGIQLLPGIEFSARLNRLPVHVLGYGFDLQSDSLLAFCEGHIQRRIERNRLILQKLSEHGFSVSEEEVVALCGFSGKRIYGRPHIAQVMVHKGYVRDIRQAFERWIGDRRPCFALGPIFSVSETLDVLHQASGKAVIAHPHLINSKSLIKELLRLPFDGIEGYYAQMLPQQEEQWVRLGREKKWLVTGGSDYHGAIKKQNPLGCSWVGRDVFDALQA